MRADIIMFLKAGDHSPNWMVF